MLEPCWAATYKGCLEKLIADQRLTDTEVRVIISLVEQEKTLSYVRGRFKGMHEADDID